MSQSLKNVFYQNIYLTEHFFNESRNIAIYAERAFFPTVISHDELWTCCQTETLIVTLESVTMPIRLDRNKIH